MVDVFILRPGLPDISDRQFGAGLWHEQIITYDEFLAFIGPGTLPAAAQAIVDQLPDDDTGQPTPRKEAIGFLAGSKIYEFAHPLVEIVRQSMEAKDPRWTPAYLRDRWTFWSTL